MGCKCLYEAGKYNKIQLLDLFCEAVVPCLGNSTASNHHLGSGISSSSDHSIHHQYLISEKCSFICQAIRKVRVENLDILALKLVCKVGLLPSSYLGLPLGTLFKPVAVWEWVEEWFCKRLAMWGTLEWKPHLLKWVVICSDGMKDKRGALWKQVINGKYGVNNGGWSIRAVREGYGVGLWKVIKKEGNLE
ncbi:hypothetical protein CK203_030410 [Vitis vinifera]|uniref:Uncharacterized protein n=1 Tax=Vitis vinifera TaxID=29760 RepID=A0A438IV84_VITVI|nr:hypothetical protein CK203_030410 [Vitis vinifera]